MKKYAWFFVLILFVWQCKKDNDNVTPPVQFDINEGQNNWIKQIVAQRPVGDIPTDPPGSFCPVEIIPAFLSGDTSTFIVNFYKIAPFLSVYISYHHAQAFMHKITFDGIILSIDQSGINTFALRRWNNNTYFGKALHYGTSWTWQQIPYYASQIKAISTDTLLLLDNNTLRISYNAGQQWTTLISASFNKMYRFGKEIWLTRDSNVYVITTSASTPQWKFTLPHIVTSLYKKDSLMLAGTEKGKIFISKDNGTTWEKKFDGSAQFGQNQNIQIVQFLMLDGWNGFALLVPDNTLNYSSTYPSALSVILRTTDGGQNWQANYITQLIKLRYFAHVGQKIIACGYQPAHPTLSGVYFVATTTLGN